MKSIRIVRLYPEELNLYGDAGNVLCLAYRLQKRHFGTEILGVGIGDSLPEFDILVIGGGQDREMQLITHDLLRKTAALTHAAESGKTVFAVCAGFQLLGEHYCTADGKKMHLTGALPFYTEAADRRMIGNCVFSSPFGSIVGFENHSGKTYLSSTLTPLGQVISGYGNNGQDGTEGVLYKNTFGTYAHGPVLPKNPSLADEILRRAIGDELTPLDDRIELQCHAKLIRRFAGKEYS